MFSLSFLLIVFIGHFLADFVMQNDEMALNKSKSFFALTYHVIVYQSVLSLAFAPIWMHNFYKSDINDIFVGFMLISGWMHFLTDYWTSRLNSRLYQLPSKHWFFVGIGFDQIIHYVTILMLLKMFGVNF